MFALVLVLGSSVLLLSEPSLPDASGANEASGKKDNEGAQTFKSDLNLDWLVEQKHKYDRLLNDESESEQAIEDRCSEALSGYEGIEKQAKKLLRLQRKSLDESGEPNADWKAMPKARRRQLQRAFDAFEDFAWMKHRAQWCAVEDPELLGDGSEAAEPKKTCSKKRIAELSDKLREDFDQAKKARGRKTIKHWEEWYQLFGFEKKADCTRRKLTKAYRKLTLKYHPDKHPPECAKRAHEWSLVLGAGRELMIWIGCS